jgi:hypothetical protein
MGENWNTGEYSEYAFVANDPKNYWDILGLEKGKRKLDVEHRGKRITPKSPIEDIDDAIGEAIDDGMSQKHIDNLKGIKKVRNRIKKLRGGNSIVGPGLGVERAIEEVGEEVKKDAEEAVEKQDAYYRRIKDLNDDINRPNNPTPPTPSKPLQMVASAWYQCKLISKIGNNCIYGNCTKFGPLWGDYSLAPKSIDDEISSLPQLDVKYENNCPAGGDGKCRPDITISKDFFQ